MRVFVALLLLLGTAGCTDADWAEVASYVRDHGTFGGESAVSADRAPLALPPDRHCQEVASDRSADVADQGFDSDTRKAVYDSAYADCIAWAARKSNVSAKQSFKPPGGEDAICIGERLQLTSECSLPVVPPGRPPALDWQSWEPLDIAIWCEELRSKLIRQHQRLPIWAVKQERMLKPLREKRKKLVERQRGLIAQCQAIRAQSLAGEIDEGVAREQLATLNLALGKTFAELAKLEAKFRRTTEKVLRGRGKESHTRVAALAVARPWGVEAKVLKAASAHFSEWWKRPI